MEQLAFVLIYFLTGSLPWQDDQALAQVASSKAAVGTLTKNLPAEFAQFLGYCRQLDFKEKPDYRYLKQLFSDLYFSKGYSQDSQFDWQKLKATSLQLSTADVDFS